MLNGGTLDGATISVTSDLVSDEHPDEAPLYGAPDAATEGTDGYEQHDKPRAGIVAELLAKGYVLSEHILHKAIEVDQKQVRDIPWPSNLFQELWTIIDIFHFQGISARFLNYIKGLDKTLGQKISGPETTVSDKAKSVLAQGQARAKTIDEQHGITKQAGDYYSRAIASPFGQKVVAFYTQTAKQVAEVHEEATRIAQAEKEKAATAAPSTGATGYTAAGHTEVPAPTTTAPGGSY
jgi:hypothetical protein